MLRRHFTNQTKKDVFVEDPLVIPDGYVDLGLSVQWATCNLGAENPEDPGYFYSKGNVNGHKLLDTGLFEDGYTFSEEAYENSPGYENIMNKINNPSALPANDRIWINLDAVYQDAAMYNADYATVFSPCTPSISQWQELIDNTVCTYEILNGVDGLRFTASNDNSIFIPIKCTVAYDNTIGGLTDVFRGFIVTDGPDDVRLRYTVATDNSVTFEFYNSRKVGKNAYGYMGGPIRPVRRNINIENCQIIRPGYNYLITNANEMLGITDLIPNRNITIYFQSDVPVENIYVKTNSPSSILQQFNCVNNQLNVTTNDITINRNIYANNTVFQYLMFETVTAPIVVSIVEWEYPYTNKSVQFGVQQVVAKKAAAFRIPYAAIENSTLNIYWNSNSRLNYYFCGKNAFATTSTDIFKKGQKNVKGTITIDKETVNSWKEYVDEYGYIYVQLSHTASSAQKFTFSVVQE